MGRGMCMNVMRMKLKLMKNQKGMTLIELMAVVVILGILAAVAGTAIMNSFDKSKTNADATSVKVIQEAAQRYVMDKNPADTALTDITIQKLVDEGYLESVPKSQVDGAKPNFKLTVSRDSNSKKYTFTVETTS